MEDFYFAPIAPNNITFPLAVCGPFLPNCLQPQGRRGKEHVTAQWKHSPFAGNGYGLNVLHLGYVQRKYCHHEHRKCWNKPFSSWEPCGRVWIMKVVSDRLSPTSKVLSRNFSGLSIWSQASSSSSWWSLYFIAPWMSNLCTNPIAKKKQKKLSKSFKYKKTRPVNHTLPFHALSIHRSWTKSALDLPLPPFLALEPRGACDARFDEREKSLESWSLRGKFIRTGKRLQYAMMLNIAQ